MDVIYAREPLPDRVTRTVFLAGPTPRSPDVPSWRPQALEALARRGHDGHVFVPEPRDGRWREGYEDQVGWEEDALNRADAILFWVPRDLRTLPGLTTNDEFGYWKGRDPARLVLGTPEGATSVRYQQHYAARLGIPLVRTLDEAAVAVAALLGDGAARSGGECHVPLHVWRTPAFQSWHTAQRAAGNRLDGARVEWVFRAGPRQAVFFWALHVKVWVAAEQRHKDNEVVLARPDTAAVVLYRPGPTPLDTEVVLVREFRAPATTPDGCVWEVPGGSGWEAGAGHAPQACTEVMEETGVILDPSQLQAGKVRQLAATLSAHKAHQFAVRLTAEQVEGLRRQEAADVTHGVAQDTERTGVRVRTVRQILAGAEVDWSVLGMVLSVVLEAGVG
jgi:hypothetical protein